MSTARATTTPVRHADRFFIGGEWVEPSSDATFDVIDSGTEEVVLHDRGGGRPTTWLARSPPRGTRSTTGRGRGLRTRSAPSTSARSPRPWGSATTCSASCGRASRACSTRRRSTPGGSAPVRSPRTPALADTFPFEEESRPTAGGEFGLLVREPVGVVGAIIPWNAPVGLICHKIGPALLAGCTVVLKSAPEAPGEAYMFAEAAEQIGLPPGVLNVVTADREVSELLVRDPRRRQDHVHRVDRGRPAHRVAVRRADRAVHARARRQVGGGRARRHGPRDRGRRPSRNAECGLNGQVCSSLTRVIVTEGPPRRARRRARRDASARSRSATRSTRRRSSGRSSSERQRDRVARLHRQGRRRGRDARDRRRPARRTSTAATSWSPPCSATSTTAPRSASEEIFGPVLA